MCSCMERYLFSYIEIVVLDLELTVGICSLWGGDGAAPQRRDGEFGDWENVSRLTPRHLLRQLEPSWFFKGQTTSSLESEMEKDEVKVERGGILTPPYTVDRFGGVFAEWQDKGV